MTKIPLGYCQCGCGEKTRIAQATHKRLGYTPGDPLRYIVGHNARLSPLEYIEEHRGHKTPCWIWQRSKDQHGYGACWYGAKRYKAHRWYYECHVGPIPEGLSLDHLCRVPSCVNPAHLKPVTHAENCRRGAQAKLTHEQVRTILASDESDAAMALRFGVSEGNVLNIRAGRVWAGATDDLKETA